MVDGDSEERGAIDMQRGKGPFAMSLRGLLGSVRSSWRSLEGVRVTATRVCRKKDIGVKVG